VKELAASLMLLSWQRPGVHIMQNSAARHVGCLACWRCHYHCAALPALFALARRAVRHVCGSPRAEIRATAASGVYATWLSVAIKIFSEFSTVMF
jgi:hypothetical protein